MQELLFKHPWCPSGPTGVFFPNQISRGLHHWCKGLWGVQRMPGACMCVQTGPDAYAWGPSQCRRVVMEGEREWSLHWFSCPRPSNYMAGAPWHTHQGWSLKSAQAWWAHTHTASLVPTVQGEARRGSLPIVHKWGSNRGSESPTCPRSLNVRYWIWILDFRRSHMLPQIFCDVGLISVWTERHRLI